MADVPSQRQQVGSGHAVGGVAVERRLEIGHRRVQVIIGGNLRLAGYVEHGRVSRSQRPRAIPDRAGSARVAGEEGILAEHLQSLDVVGTLGGHIIEHLPGGGEISCRDLSVDQLHAAVQPPRLRVARRLERTHARVSIAAVTLEVRLLAVQLGAQVGAAGCGDQR